MHYAQQQSNRTEAYMKAVISSTLPASQAEVWRRLKQTKTLFYVSRPWVVFANTSLFPEEWSTGHDVITKVRPFGLGKGSRYHIHIERVFEKQHTILTREQGGPIKTWNHTMEVARVDSEHCQYTDTVEVKAGALTPVLWLYVQLYYRHRHRCWRKLLAR